MAACRVWAREEDGVAAFPTPRRKDCLDNWSSSIQFIAREVLCPFTKHALSKASALHNTRYGVQIIRMVALADLYLPSLNPELEELYNSIQSVDDAFKRASYEMDGYGHATKKIMPDDFDEIAESFRKSFTTLLATLKELVKKRH